ncbi:GntR family transcriptional regulator [Azospirillum sp. SYSU D00513]|uniref:GntR family transcriptional regulator n=1 Tax=Azospirillum sp. SYSU D00513 TaxID=2812561 RepID=UPI001A95C267|nr:GntR family transcriptional regulator [Azospirillum sp. SYSU D00513]
MYYDLTESRSRHVLRTYIEPIDRPPSLTEVAATRLRTLIIEGEMPFGQLLSENRLATLLCVSKTPVREALAQLKAEGLVEVQPYKGTFIFTPNPAEIAPLCEYWGTLLSAATRSAYHRARDELLLSLEEPLLALQAACEEQDVVAAIRAEMAAYAIPFLHCENPFLLEAQRMIESKIVTLRVHACRHELASAAFHREAERFVAALRTGAPEAAVEILNGRIAEISGVLESSVTRAFV